MPRCVELGCGLLLLGLAVGCRQAAIEPAAPAASRAAPVAALPAPDPKLARLPLSDRLALEADARPAQALRMDELAARLSERGVVFAKKRQVLASTIGAAYCELGATAEGLGVSLCEFADHAAAVLGEARSHQTFDALIPGRTLRARENSLLTLTQAEGETAQRQAKRVEEAFAALPLSAREIKTALVR